MRSNITQKIMQYLQKHRKNKVWRSIVMALACVVVFCTTYALILPAITAGSEAICGIEEHIHTEECYRVRGTVYETVMICSPDQDLHVHEDGCYDQSGSLVCGYADYLLHSHEASCYGEGGELICTLKEIEPHTHGDSCYKQPHSHDESCYIKEQGDLVCSIPDGDIHTHGESCFKTNKELICAEEEIAPHSHEDSCYTENRELSCQASDEPDHVHEDSCYTITRDLSCGQEERTGHSHGEECYKDVQIQVCSREEGAAHSHTGSCYSWNDVLSCDKLTAEEGALPELKCKLKEVEAHTHGDSCFDEEGNLLCEKLQITEHIHDESCFAVNQYESEELVLTCGMEQHEHGVECYAADPMTDPTLEGDVLLTEEVSYICGIEAHVHGEECYSEESVLVCTMAEHVHEESCLPQDIVYTEEQLAEVDAVISAINALPSADEIEDTLAALEDDEDAYVSYLEELIPQVQVVYSRYQALSPGLVELVTNSDILLDLEWIWGAETIEFASTDTVNVTAVNYYNWEEGCGAVVFQNSSGGTIATSTATGGHTEFKYWIAARIVKENGRYVVKSINSNTPKNSTTGYIKSDTNVPANGYTLVYHLDTLKAEPDVQVGDVAEITGDLTGVKKYSGQTYGTIRFVRGQEKAYKDNTEQLHPVNAASTKDFIELNLYDYGSGSTGRNINEKHNSDKKMPGFQQNGGTKGINSLAAFKSTYNFNFGDNITSDLADGMLVTLSDLEPVGINVVRDSANSPISIYSDVMQKTLGSDGYPALADGTSLGYLFGAETYSKKMNTDNVDGLFLYNDNTGAYSFNSRENFAQFNKTTNKFTLYQEIFTPNFIMYPFGNFMPFNDIVHDSKKVSDMNEAYFQEMALQAYYLYQIGKGDAYKTLSTALNQMMDYAIQDGWGSGWKAERALQHYFYWGCKEDGSGDLPPFAEAGIPLNKLYNLDYDVPSDFYFGMDMKMNFMQPKAGLTGKDGKQPMVFYFTGDDDVWVYIDGRLFLDLSGIHRHVGGEIDFVNGVVKYYRLETKPGDVGSDPIKTVKFSELVADPSLLNEKGTFKDYSIHSFNFYYMERGSGSSVCRLNFNFPLLRNNSISVTKELSVDQENKLELLGNPDFSFQVLKENGQDLFVGPGVGYDVLDLSGNMVGSGVTDENGIFTIKANQTAVFSGIAENSGKYFVRELLDTEAFKQYGKITVDGTSQTTDYNVTVGSDSFKGVNSPVKDVSDGSTAFLFDNQVIFDKLGSLTIKKTLSEYPKSRALLSFDFLVTLDGQPLAAGTQYQVGEEIRTVAEPGIITLAPGETAKLSKILAGSSFTVEETELSSAGYVASYTLDGVTQSTGNASGIITTDHCFAIEVNNREQGTGLSIPVKKTLNSPDGSEHSYVLKLQQVVSDSDLTPAEPEFIRTLPISITEGTVSSSFELGYAAASLGTLPKTLYYKITEEENPEEKSTVFDSSVYVIKVVISEEGGSCTAAVESVWKDGQLLSSNNGELPEISFTNEIQWYSLPSTGGEGSVPYILGGLLLMGLAGAYMLRRRKGRNLSH